MMKVIKFSKPFIPQGKRRNEKHKVNTCVMILTEVNKMPTISSTLGITGNLSTAYSGKWKKN